MTINTWKFLRHVNVPVTNDEIEISNMLDICITATMYNNFEILDSIIAEEASFFLLEGGVRNKKEFLNWRKKIGLVLRQLRYINLVIKINTETSATVTFVRYSQLINFEESSHDRYFDLIKYNNVWKIVKSGPR